MNWTAHRCVQHAPPTQTVPLCPTCLLPVGRMMNWRMKHSQKCCPSRAQLLRLHLRKRQSSSLFLPSAARTTTRITISPVSGPLQLVSGISGVVIALSWSGATASAPIGVSSISLAGHSTHQAITWRSRWLTLGALPSHSGTSSCFWTNYARKWPYSKGLVTILVTILDASSAFDSHRAERLRVLGCSILAHAGCGHQLV